MYEASSSMSLGIFSSEISSKYSSSFRTSYGYRSVIPRSPLPRGSSAMTCSRELKTTLPERHHAFLADRLANDRECLLPDLAINHREREQLPQARVRPRRFHLAGGCLL
jgi:hypothetical protein